MAWAIQNSKGRYVGRYRDSRGRKKTLKGQTFNRKSDAERAAAVEESKQRRSRTDSDMTWGEWLEIWQGERRVEASTQAEDTKRIDYHLTPQWNGVKLSEITRAEVKAWRADLLKEYEEEVRGKTVKKRRSAATVNRIISLFSKSLTEAVDSEVIEYNPALKLTLPEGQETKERYLSKDEFRRVAEKLSPAWARIATILVYTGMRWGEMKIHSMPGYSKKRIDRKRGVILIAEVWDDKNEVVKLYPKGGKRRTIPLPTKVADVLPEFGPVALSPRGSMPGNNNFRRALNVAADRAGVERFTPHDLRHTYASWLIQSGMSVEEVRTLLGHKSVLTTQRYTHLGEVPSERVLRALA